MGLLQLFMREPPWPLHCGELQWCLTEMAQEIFTQSLYAGGKAVLASFHVFEYNETADLLSGRGFLKGDGNCPCAHASDSLVSNYDACFGFGDSFLQIAADERENMLQAPGHAARLA